MKITEAEAFLDKSGVNLNPHELWATQWHLQFQVREQFIEKFGFAIPTIDALKAIAEKSPTLEIGSGAGYWSYELAKLGAQITATDAKTGNYRLNGSCGFWKSSWCAVEKLAAVGAIKQYPTKSLLTVWPDYGSPWPVKALEAFNGEYVFYVGEGMNGCTGNDAFHEYLTNVFYLYKEIRIPQFAGIHDSLFCYQRKIKT